jgi:hypothetical protein
MNEVKCCPECLSRSGTLIYYASQQTSCAVCKCPDLAAFRQTPEDPPTIGQVLEDPAASFWMKGALSSALARDPVDAANDSELLARLLDARCQKVLPR